MNPGMLVWTVIAAAAAEAAASEGPSAVGPFVWFMFVFGLFGGLIMVIASTKFVSQGYAGIVERMGKYAKTVGPGVHFLMPIFSRMIRINLKEQYDHYEPQVAITKDHMQVRVDAVLFFRIIDPKKSIYDVDNFKAQVETLTVATLRNVIGGMSLSECLRSRDFINTKLREVLDEHTGRMGVKVTGLEINSIDPPKDFREAMELEKRAEIMKNAAIINAEGEKTAAITQAEGRQTAMVTLAQGERDALKARAEGERDAARLRAEGKAQAYASLFGAIKSADIDSSVLSVRYLEALEKVANGKATTLILPSDSSSVLGAVAQLAQTFGAVNAKLQTSVPAATLPPVEGPPMKTVEPDEPDEPDEPPAMPDPAVH